MALSGEAWVAQSAVCRELSISVDNEAAYLKLLDNDFMDVEVHVVSADEEIVMDWEHSIWHVTIRGKKYAVLVQSY
jgi:hypothetical protein